MTRTWFAATAVVALAFVISGCASPTTPTAPAGASPSASVSADGGPQALPPTIVSPGELDGTDVAVIVGTALVVAVDDGTEDQWRGTTTDPAIAEFSAGGAEGGATFRPGFEAREIGTTQATLTAPDGREIAFTISVVAP
ncbi:hypothetical protein MHY30_01290 [Microbacterium sp. ACRRU]|uniref:hypothetical protein n=1 Tax=Microbacterium TaxID=33882 RepID=UPI001EF5E358|nr:hypothetical protein [Microbacterium sp. ACRRU]MCG7416143.1 hypothetical protein [Microbacterium sp. ACRRU]